jgi:peptidyl-prolyl cis-trans isomerase SurA
MFFKLFILGLVVFQTNTIVVDRVVAVVNQEIITLSDIDKAIKFYDFKTSEAVTDEKFYRLVLKHLIDYKIVYLQYRNEFVLKQEDFEKLQIPIIEKFGSLQKAKKELSAFDMTWEDLQDFIEERVVYEKAIKEKIQDKLIVSQTEIEDFYHQQYVAEQQRLSLLPKTLLEISAEIEDHLKKIKTESKLQSWLNSIKSQYIIENKW